jgi:hypothetical protein
MPYVHSEVILPENTMPHVREVLIKHWAEAARFSEYGWEA